ncbi:unnamed protein product [Soboliphyme baturini]|uniref:Carboxylic ester hydrolase n=1 Tax=Soboliphyme baturini TaxID=241478 RepID=A0A183IYG2_9BILA|nr:unnamed protein product [Soboliphyme baturini]
MPVLLCLTAILLALTLAHCCEGSGSHETPPSPFVQTSYGPVTGTSVMAADKEVLVFSGVPFAKAPLGDLRYHLAQDPDSWQEPMSCIKLAPACYQRELYPGSGMKIAKKMIEDGTMSEDCLRLNLWVPAGKQNLTTMVWIFGGGFFSGSPSDPTYDGAELAARGNVIVANINYRLGPFGFVHFGDEAVPSNLGLLDQRQALRFLHQNIRLFGGDETKITLFGNSAGAASVSAHLVAKKSWPYFNRAIVQSGVMNAPWTQNSPEKERNGTLELLRKLNCNSGNTTESVRCLRSVQPMSIITAATELSQQYQSRFFVPVNEDRQFFEGNALMAIAGGAMKNCSILIGYNTDDGSFLIPLILRDVMIDNPQAAINHAQAEKVLTAMFQDISYTASQSLQRHVFRREPVGRNTTVADRYFYRDSIIKAGTEHFFTCSIKEFADQMANTNSSVFMYHFAEPWTVKNLPSWMGVTHGLEIDYVFARYLKHRADYSKKTEIFSQAVADIWTSFAKEG